MIEQLLMMENILMLLLGLSVQIVEGGGEGLMCVVLKLIMFLRLSVIKIYERCVFVILLHKKLLPFHIAVSLYLALPWLLFFNLIHCHLSVM